MSGEKRLWFFDQCVGGGDLGFGKGGRGVETNTLFRDLCGGV